MEAKGKGVEKENANTSSNIKGRIKHSSSSSMAFIDSSCTSQ